MDTPSFTVDQMRQLMDRALVDEIKKQHIDDRARRHPVSNGKLLSVYHGHFIYDFALEDPWDVADDTPAILRFDGRKEAKGTIVHMTGASVKITTDEQLPPAALDKAYLVDDPTALLEALRVALKSCSEGQAQLGSKSFGLRPYRSGSHVPAIPYGLHFQPQESQGIAIAAALGSEVTYIVGPPGTGKTSTLAAIALAHICAGKTVLIAAHTNIAIDNAIMRLAEFCKATPQSVAYQLLEAGSLLRFGPPQLMPRLQQEHPEIHLATMVKRRSGELAQRREQLQTAYDDLQQQITTQEQLHAATQHHQRLQQQELLQQRESNRQELHALQQQERTRITHFEHQQQEAIRQQKQQQTQLTQQQMQFKADASQYVAHMTMLEARLAEAQKMNTIVRLLKGVPSPHTLAQKHTMYQQKYWTCEQATVSRKKQMETLYQQRATLEERIAQWTHTLKMLEMQRATPTPEQQKITQLQATLKRIDLDLEQLQASFADFEQTLRTLKTKQEQVRQQISALDAQLANVEQKIVAEARVIATTLTKTYMNPLISGRSFDVVMMDEVSMASLPSVYVAAARASHSVVILGDPQQLSPIVQAETQEAKAWLGRSLFNVRGIDLKEAETGKGNSCILREQSRMHPAIASIAQTYIYPNILKNSKHLKEKPAYDLVHPLPESRLLLCDTSDAQPTAVKPEHGSRINAYHALCTIELARQVLATLPMPKPKSADFRIGLITPYKKQARLLQKLVKDAHLQDDIRVGTVHRFQGLEAEAILFDTVESPPLPITFTKGSYDSDAMRLINVAVTRTQQKLILIANYQYIQHALEQQDTLRQAVEAAHHAGVLSSRTVLSWSQSTKTPLPLSTARYQPEFLREEPFYAHFQQDIQLAQKALVIYSPFIGKERTQRLLPLFEARCKAGLAITVITSSETRQINQEAEAQLQQIGVIIQKKAAMHEKMAMIDDTIAYIGSLNILSHIRTSEFMERVVSPGYVSELKRFHQGETIIKKPVQRGPDIEVLYHELPTTISTCQHCGKALVLRKRHKDRKPFYTCPDRRASKDHTLEEAPKYLSRLAQYSCGSCGGDTTLKTTFDEAWLECATPSACGYKQYIIYKD